MTTVSAPPSRKRRCRSGAFRSSFSGRARSVMLHEARSWTFSHTLLVLSSGVKSCGWSGFKMRRPFVSASKVGSRSWKRRLQDCGPHSQQLTNNPTKRLRQQQTNSKQLRLVLVRSWMLQLLYVFRTGGSLRPRLLPQRRAPLQFRTSCSRHRNFTGRLSWRRRPSSDDWRLGWKRRCAKLRKQHLLLRRPVPKRRKHGRQTLTLRMTTATVSRAQA
mmetsp:Transcript_66149/g.166824  ORF Transcript_66149/g.166824 Transcript_66149/m.166824 type:complete len:217 (-) Transcript_66149:710-1360(-)